MNLHVTLQIEFKYRQACTRFVKHIKKVMPQYFDYKAERCVWLKFDKQSTRDRVKEIILAETKYELRKRESGIEYLYVN
jgi:hypothetical protein